MDAHLQRETKCFIGVEIVSLCALNVVPVCLTTDKIFFNFLEGKTGHQLLTVEFVVGTFQRVVKRNQAAFIGISRRSLTLVILSQERKGNGGLVFDSYYD